VIVPPPRPGPAPQQVFNSKIVRIQFPTVGGLVFFRVRQEWLGSKNAPNGTAFVSGLPRGWAQFNMFSGTRERDPTVTGPEKGVFDPVTDNMLSQYRWWPHDAPVLISTIKPGSPPTTVIIIDTATWTLVYAHHITNRLLGVFTREHALDLFKSLANSNAPGYEGLDPNLMGVALVNNVGQDIPVPSAEFYADAAALGWAYHEETAPGTSVYYGDFTATWILNLSKLYKDAPKVNGKKPLTYTFRIDLPAKDDAGSTTWTLQASANTSRVSKPPKSDDGRRTFPVHDVGSGDDAQHLVPAWTPWPDDKANFSVPEPKAGSYVDVKITFGTPKTKPKVEIIDHTQSGITVG
jgi:hypothetical protein